MYPFVSLFYRFIACRGTDKLLTFVENIDRVHNLQQKSAKSSHLICNASSSGNNKDVKDIRTTVQHSTRFIQYALIQYLRLIFFKT